MAGKEKFVFTFEDLYGERPNEVVSVMVKHMVLSNRRNEPRHDARKRLTIEGLDSGNGGRYQVQVFSTRYRPENVFLRVTEDKKLEHTFVMVPDPAWGGLTAAFPSYADLGTDLKTVLENSTVEGNEDKKGEALFEALKDLRAAGLLNLYAKMKATRFDDGVDAFSFVTSLRRVRGERFFADVKKDFRDAVKNSLHSHLFDKVSGSLHKPPPGYVLDDSFKTPDAHGNLQVTFFRKADALEFIADVDIDGSKGLEHAFDVISHSITGKDSHPYDIHAILFRSEAQKIDTGYRLVV